MNQQKYWNQAAAEKEFTTPFAHAGAFSGFSAVGIQRTHFHHHEWASVKRILLYWEGSIDTGKKRVPRRTQHPSFLKTYLLAIASFSSFVRAGTILFKSPTIP